MKKNHILVISILLFAGGFCSAATPVNIGDFTGTDWVVYGKNKMSASVIGNESVEGIGYLNFGVDGHSFSVTDTDDYTMYGTYGVDSKGKLYINVTLGDVQSFFDDYLSSYAGYVTVTATSAKSSCKVTYSGNMATLAVTISAKANININYQGTHYNGKISFTLNMSGDHPVAGGAPNWASKWNITNAKASFSTKKIKVSKVMNLELTLGDFGSSGLGLNEYLLTDTGSAVLSSDMQSDFCRSKNTVHFWGVESGIDTTLQNLILSNDTKGNIQEVDISSAYAKVTATVKDGQTVSLAGTVYFWADYYYNDGTPSASDVKGTLKFSGKGVPVP
jgi:hypothetical protein